MYSTKFSGMRQSEFVDLMYPVIEKVSDLILTSSPSEEFEIEGAFTFAREWYSLLTGVKHKTSLLFLKEFCLSESVTSKSVYGLAVLFELGIANMVQMF